VEKSRDWFQIAHSQLGLEQKEIFFLVSVIFEKRAEKTQRKIHKFF